MLKINCGGEAQCEAFYAQLISDVLDQAELNGQFCNIDVPEILVSEQPHNQNSISYSDQAQQRYDDEYNTICDWQSCTAYYAKIIQELVDQTDSFSEECDAENPDVNYCESAAYYIESFYVGWQGNPICEQHNIDIISDFFVKAANSEENCNITVPTLTH